jgi:hypothetical protein
MTAIKATWTNGQVVLDGQVDWPEGLRLFIEPDPSGLHPSLADRDGTLTPGEIEEILAAMDQMEPLEMSDAELAAWEADRRAQKEWEKAHFEKRAEKLRGIWE